MVRRGALVLVLAVVAVAPAGADTIEERKQSVDAKIAALGQQVAATQRKEIKEMDWLVQDIEENGPATTREDAEQRPVPDFEGAAMGQRDAWRAAQTLLRALLALPLVGNVAR